TQRCMSPGSPRAATARPGADAARGPGTGHAVSPGPDHEVERGDGALIDKERVLAARRDLGDANVAEGRTQERRLIIRHRPEVIADGDALAAVAERERDLHARPKLRRAVEPEGGELGAVAPFPVGVEDDELPAFFQNGTDLSCRRGNVVEAAHRAE